MPRNRKLDRNFFARGADAVARDLLGKVLVRRFSDGSSREGIITETEAYLGVKDLACHAAGGRRTKRTEVMYGRAGYAYIYLVYGMHWMLNVICSTVGDPQAVLIRGLNVADGPARLTKFLKINKGLNCEDLAESKRLFLEDRGIKVEDGKVETTSRIGVDYAGDWKDKPLRFADPLNKLKPRDIL
ncbi:MAG: DNA-3-methyladenine glycosylase [Patescibacteria group bacterium]|nr:MAG: DNA-3-methyladenine glycosylase [Patescibacteria group bacterium]